MKGWAGVRIFYRDQTIRIDNTTYFTTRIHLTRLESDPTRIRDPWTRWSPLPAVRRRCAGRIWPLAENWPSCRAPGAQAAEPQPHTAKPCRGLSEAVGPPPRPAEGVCQSRARTSECRRGFHAH